MANEFWKGRNVLVTGCTGLLGSWLTRSLAEKEANVVGLIRDVVPRSNLNWSGFDNQIITVRGEIEAYLLLAKCMDDKKIHGEAFNFSTERPLIVAEIVKKILEIMGSDLEPSILNKTTNEIIDQYLSAQKARNLLNWKPLYTLEKALKRLCLGMTNSSEVNF